ncbi:MAG: hypothetical protein KDB22_27835 [Planctomycetales bacterium]|nr:hypothetical protein [Planctomycetales bacterium]
MFTELLNRLIDRIHGIFISKRGTCRVRPLQDWRSRIGCDSRTVKRGYQGYVQNRFFAYPVDLCDGVESDGKKQGFRLANQHNWRTRCVLWVFFVPLCWGFWGCDPHHSNDAANEKLSSEFEIVSSSMAPALCGPTRVSKCQHCGVRQHFAADTFNAKFPVRCYNCGAFIDIGVETAAGDRVHLSPIRHSIAEDTGGLQRFALVAFRAADSGPLQVKRIWGEPGESVAIRRGEFWVNGELLQKSLAELKRLAVPLLVFPPESQRVRGQVADRCLAGSRQFLTIETDRERLPAEDSPASIPSDSVFAPADSRIPDSANTIRIQPGEFLTWRHAVPARVHPESVPSSDWMKPSIITDDLPINQGVSYPTFPVPDVLLAFQLLEPLAGSLEIRLEIAGRQITVLAEAAPVGELAGDDIGPITMQKSIEVAICDCRVLVASDCQPELARAIESEQRIAAATFDNSELGPDVACDRIEISSDAVVVFERLFIGRDLYLRDQLNGELGGASAPMQLGQGEYYLLGDNQPVSADSRSSIGPIGRQQIIGTVIPAM